MRLIQCPLLFLVKIARAILESNIATSLNTISKAVMFTTVIANIVIDDRTAALKLYLPESNHNPNINSNSENNIRKIGAATKNSMKAGV